MNWVLVKNTVIRFSSSCSVSERCLSVSFSLKTFGENIYQFVNLNESHSFFQFTNSLRSVDFALVKKLIDIEVTSDKVEAGAETTLTCQVSGISSLSSTLHLEWTDQV